MNKLIQIVLAAILFQFFSTILFPVLNCSAETSGLSATILADVQKSGDNDTINKLNADSKESGLLSKPADNGEIESDINSLSTSKKSKENQSHFYQKWWFTLIIILLILPVLWKFFQNRENDFIKKIATFKKQNEDLTQALKEKENYYIEHEKDVESKLLEEERLKFQATGLAKFSEIISNNRNDIKKLGQTIISELVDYVGAQSGTIYITNENEDEETVLEMLSAFAPSAEQIKAKIHPGEGYVGACFNEGTIMEIDNVPDTYAKISSGLGETLPRFITFIPLLQDEEKLGVIEMASFKKIEPFKLEFVKNLTRDISSSIAIKRANERMQEMLARSRSQAEELLAQEEEMRQNMEEMQATQEELKRQAEINKKMQDELIKEKALLDSLMNYLPDYIYYKDMDSKFIRVSQSMKKIFDVSDPKEMIGKSDFDFIEKETAQKYFDEEQEIIRKGKSLIDVVKHEVFDNGTDQWSSITKMPLIDEEGNTVGLFGITKDITSIKKMEIEAKERNEELASQEEELRQNLEEMQTIQEELSKEKYLMDALLENIPESIYFKDLESKFLKSSNSMAKLFGLSSASDLIGKSDFDFFDEEHARPAYEDEQRIIKTGKPIFDLVEKEVHKDGSVTWVTTTKMPLKNQNGKIVGTFGISKDITEQRKMEIDVIEKNEALQAQEEELRQNLEEMQTIQEDLAKEKYLMDALLENIPESIYFKDLESKFLKSSNSLVKLFGLSSASDLIGKSDFDFFDEEHARPAYEDEQRIIKTGKPIVDLVEKEVHKDGSVSWVATTKMPLKDHEGKIVGTFGISKDITKQRKMEIDVIEKNEALQAQEEELRQNLEEMQTIQEDLQKQVKEREKIKEECEQNEKKLLKQIQLLKKQK